MTVPVLRKLARGSGFGSIIGVVLVLIAVTAIDYQGWWTAQTLSNVVHFTSILALLAMGQALVIISKEIDLSVGSVNGLSGVTSITPQADLGVGGAMVAALVVAVLCGLVQALAVVRGGLPSMIVTLGGLFAFRGVIYVWTGLCTRVSRRSSRALADPALRG